MLRRIDVHNMIVTAVGAGVPVIFRPPQKHTLTYPCVVYDISRYPKSHSNDNAYVLGEEYEISFLSQRPGDGRGLNILRLPGSAHLRSFINEDIVHDIFRLSYMTS